MTPEDEYRAILDEHRAILDEINEYLQTENQGRLTGTQQVVLAWCLQDRDATYQQIAKASGYQSGSLRDAASKLHQKLRSALAPYDPRPTSDKFDKRIFGEQVKSWYEQRKSPYGLRTAGREKDLKRLLAAINLHGRRLVCISGSIGMGKTELVHILCRQLMTQRSEPEGFEQQIRCFAADVSTVQALYAYVCQKLSSDRKNPEDNPALALKDLLRHRRLLLVIDRGELLYDPRSPEGRFKSDSACYEQWLRKLLDVPDLQSCLIWIGRTEPKCLQGRKDHLHRLPPLKLAPACALLNDGFREYGFPALAQQDLEALAEFCGYNPGVLKLAVRKICDEGGNSISQFLQDPLLIPDAEDDDWQEFLQSLTAQEQILLGWLLLYPDELIKTNAGEVSHFDRSAPPTSPLPADELQRIIRALRRRGLLEIDRDGNVCLQSPWLRHVAAGYLVNQLGKLLGKTHSQSETDWRSEIVQLLNPYPLIPPQAPAWKRQWHWQYVLHRSVARLPDSLWSKGKQQEMINEILDDLRQASQEDDRLREGYAVGNLLNLAVALDLPLKNLKFAGLMIHHADLRSAKIHQADFRNCQLRETVLPVLLCAPLTAALSPDGSTVAIGDRKGWVLIWRREGTRLQLDRFAHIPEIPHSAPASDPTTASITRLAFANRRILAIATDRGIYHWFFRAGEQPQPVAQVNAPVTRLACSPDDYITAGLENGEIGVWNIMLDTHKRLEPSHPNAVQALAFNPDTARLASLGFEDRALAWDLFAPDTSHETLPLMFHPDAIVWQGEALLAVGLLDRQYEIWSTSGSTSGQRVTLPYAQRAVMGMEFSQNGHYLAVMLRNAIEVWDVRQFPLSQIPAQAPSQIPAQASSQALSQPISSWVLLSEQTPTPEALMFKTLSDNGAWLLTLRDQQHVQLWEVETGKLHWEQKAVSEQGHIQQSAEQPLILEGCRGLNPAEEWYFRTLGADFGGERGSNPERNDDTGG